MRPCAWCSPVASVASECKCDYACGSLVCWHRRIDAEPERPAVPTFGSAA